MINATPSIEEREEIHKMMRNLPENESLFKCYKCRSVFDTYAKGSPVLMALIPKIDVRCPNCGANNVELMCKVDGYAVYLKTKGFKCREGTMFSGTDICPICHSAICPRCGNHSVISLSRVTGYLQSVNGWNMAKKQELADRKRYRIGKGDITEQIS